MLAVTPVPDLQDRGVRWSILDRRATEEVEGQAVQHSHLRMGGEGLSRCMWRLDCTAPTLYRQGSPMAGGVDCRGGEKRRGAAIVGTVRQPRDRKRGERGWLISRKDRSCLSPHAEPSGSSA